MNLRLLAVAMGLASPLAAQFVDAVRNNQVQANYVNTYSNWPQDQVIQYQFTNPVIKPPAPTAPATPLLQPYRSQEAGTQSSTLNVSGLPVRAREALETAAADNSGTVTTTDASGAPRFSTTVTGRPIQKEPKRSENIMGPLNNALFNSLMTIYSMETHHSSHTGRK